MYEDSSLQIYRFTCVADLTMNSIDSTKSLKQTVLSISLLYILELKFLLSALVVCINVSYSQLAHLQLVR
ncbi:hypothetical protein MKW98_005050 [Papaver atlanticum]|uniref:Uncharacterized protein n=1 Tax=Papaver atlanticum TaxID=357466 RepID=A0AAD4XX48_9MAGN|nr:hypothetical protein MKW98_005050 [Papaver atlanticum]